MVHVNWIRPAALVAVVGVFAIGCGGPQLPGPMPEKELGTKKLAAINRVADAFAKSTTNAEAFSALEDFRNTYFSPKAEPDIAKSILEVYDKRIKGKYKGDLPQQMDAAVNVLRDDLNRP